MVFIFVVIIIFLAFITSKIQIRINNLEILFKPNICKEKYKIKTKKNPTENLNFDKCDTENLLDFLNNTFNIKIKLIIFNIVPIFWININKDKILKLQRKQKYKKMLIKLKEKIKVSDILKAILNKESKKESKKENSGINLKIKKIDLSIYLGTESTMVTVLLIPILSGIISTIFVISKVEFSKQKFKLIPIYNSENVLNILISSILEINIAKLVC